MVRGVRDSASVEWSECTFETTSRTILRQRQPRREIVEQYVRGCGKSVVVAVLMLALLSAGCESAATRYAKHIADGRDYLTNGRLQEAIL